MKKFLYYQIISFISTLEWATNPSKTMDLLLKVNPLLQINLSFKHFGFADVRGVDRLL